MAFRLATMCVGTFKHEVVIEDGYDTVKTAGSVFCIGLSVCYDSFVLLREYR